MFIKRIKGTLDKELTKKILSNSEVAGMKHVLKIIISKDELVIQANNIYTATRIHDVVSEIINKYTADLI